MNFSSFFFQKFISNSTISLVDYNVLMVVGGYTGEENSALVELIDLSSEGRFCERPAFLPLPLSQMVGTFINGKAMVCGGYINFEDKDDCYEYDESAKIWSIGPSMLRGRRGAASGNLNDTHWLITGGMDTVTSEIYDSEKRIFVPSFELFEEKYWHYQIIVNASEVVITQGQGTTFDVDSYSTIDGSWDPMPRLPLGR